MVKLTKTQIDALTSKIGNEISKVISDENKILKQETIEKFLKTDVGKAVTKVNSAFFKHEPMSACTIENLALRYFNVTTKAHPSHTSIYNDIVLSSIDSTSLDELITSIKAKYNV
jgi:hypothetical protein